MSKSTLPITLGAMTFGEEGKEQARVHDLKVVQEIIDVFKKHGHSEIDTARVYCGGTSEKYLGKLDWKKQGLVMDTKLYPHAGGTFGQPITHAPEDIRKHLEASLKALNADSMDMFYLHGPDRKTDYAITLKAVNDLYKEGKFKRFGISNYYSWEVAQMCEITRANGWIQPTAYQGLYNAIHRGVEAELFPCLRKYGISFYEFNPLGGGFLAGRYTEMNSEAEEGSRFDENKMQGKMYRARYWNDANFKALNILKEASKKSGLTMPEMALRWVSHHSLMKREHGDNVLIGASSTKHIEQNLLDLEKGPLPQEVVKAIDEAWLAVKANPGSMKYWH